MLDNLHDLLCPFVFIHLLEQSCRVFALRLSTGGVFHDFENDVQSSFQCSWNAQVAKLVVLARIRTETGQEGGTVLPPSSDQGSHG